MEKDKSVLLLCWMIRNHQTDLMEAIAIYGFRSVSPLIQVLMELK